MATKKYTQAQVERIIRQAEMQGDLGNTWIQNRRILATQPKCSCDLATHTCQQKYSSDTGIWTEECVLQTALLPPAYRLSNGDGVESCVQTSCGDWTCADEAGCIHDTCGGCDITTCPPDPTKPDLTTPEGIALATLKFMEQYECSTLEKTIAEAGGLENIWRDASHPDGPNYTGWVECVAMCKLMRTVTVTIDGVQTIESVDFIEDTFGTHDATNYVPCVYEGARWDCEFREWFNNPIGVVTMDARTVYKTAFHEEMSCVGGVNHEKRILITFLLQTSSSRRASNHPGMGAVCVPKPIPKCPKPDANQNPETFRWPPNPTGTKLDDGRVLQIPTDEE